MSKPDLLKRPSKQMVCLHADAKEAIAERMHEFRFEAADKQHECGGFLLGNDIENITVATSGQNATPLGPNETSSSSAGCLLSGSAICARPGATSRGLYNRRLANERRELALLSR